MEQTTHEKVPENVRSAVSFALNRLAEIREGINRAADLERRVGQAGRYQADAFLNRRREIESARATLAEFRKVAPANGVDPDALIRFLGGEPDMTPSPEAQAWLEDSRGPVIGKMAT
ncbi:hypothetical protein LMG22037_05535 [Paraburkholderia phenoliruptrix]|uniref:Uncharacterized protein n=1 Tax=Paraburkholderia phenoliruptrix TaxID=252970 RepID=A0A6J5C967_9BURK|nr:hypothetical protein [Paraburkholderia phenoliruptrix]CAB3730479.1 hypothetical protein LMG22037_05535 [Paraburkholderia phenoliruptrix]